MKRFTKLLFLFTLIGVLSGGCELLRNTVKWEEDFEYTFTIDPTEDLNPVLNEQVIPTDIGSILDDEGIDRDKLRSAILIQVRAEIHFNSSEKTFDKLRYGELYFKLDEQSTEETMAWWPDQVAVGSVEILLDHTSNDLKQYILLDQFIIGGMAALSEPLLEQAVVTVYLLFELDGKIIGKA